jgi:hypothetical protein
VFSTNEYYRTCTPRHGTMCLTGCKGGGEVTLRSMMRIENRIKAIAGSACSAKNEGDGSGEISLGLGRTSAVSAEPGRHLHALLPRDAGSERGYQINIALTFGINCATNPQKGLPLLIHRLEDHVLPPTIAARRKCRT